MKFFIDTADLDEIREARDMGVLDGVTTNPSLMKEVGNVDFYEHVQTICELVEDKSTGGDVSAEVTATDYEGIMEEAHALAQIHENVVVKVPMTGEGVKALASLSEEGIRTNCTLCFSPAQVLVAAKVKADYISPFVGRVDDVASDGLEVVEQSVQLVNNYDFESQILAASVRHPMHVVRAALAGADVATMPFSVLDKLTDHPLTDRGLERFLADWDDYKASRKAEAGVT